MKPIDGTFVNNALKYGVAGLNIDGCRVPLDGSENLEAIQNGNIYGGNEIYGKAEQKQVTSTYKAEGRFPANIIHDGSEEVLKLFPVTESNFRKSKANGKSSIFGSGKSSDTTSPDDKGSAARFFYCAKSSKKERNAGCGELEEKHKRRDDGQSYGMNTNTHRPDGSERKEVKPQSNNHPTVKPLSLTSYLAKLILPPDREDDRKLLVPFSGSGSEMIGGLQAGWDFVCGIEKEEEYNQIAEARLKHYSKLLDNDSP